MAEVDFAQHDRQQAVGLPDCFPTAFMAQLLSHRYVYDSRSGCTREPIVSMKARISMPAGG
jgi:hypothetical protein